MSGLSIFNTPDALYEHIAAELQAYSLLKGEQHIALSGGTTPKALFDYIVASEYRTSIHWHNLHFWWGDERCVTVTDPQSNFGQAKKHLFDFIDIPTHHLHPIIPDTPEYQVASLNNELCSKALTRFIEAMAYFADTQSAKQTGMNNYLKFSWMLLGIGEDGHTASLFPNSSDLDEASPAVLVKKPETGELRISLSAKAIQAAQRVTYVALGAGKAKVMAEIIEHSSCAKQYPAALIKSESGETNYYIDQAAAGSLSAPSE